MTETFTIDQTAQETFTELYCGHKEKVYEYALLLTQSGFHAEEIVQEVFLKLWTIRGQLDQIENFPAWLCTMARNKTFDHLRRISCERIVFKDIRSRTPLSYCGVYEAVELCEEKKLVEQALRLLSPQRKMIYQLIRLAGWKREEVARALGLSPNTVKAQMTTALRQIKMYVQQASD